MPGIVGFTSPLAGTEECRGVLSRMQDLVTHFSSYKRSELFCGQVICAAHSDKTIAARGPQPYREGDVSVWFDGELIKNDRMVLTDPACGTAPTELLCRLYLQDSEFRFLAGLDGIYAAAIHDEAEQKLHLLTDRYGLRYLYWTVHRGALAWASELKAMLALPGFEPRIDRAGVGEFMYDGYLFGNRSWFEGVELLPRGTVLTWDIRKRTSVLRTYWDWSSIKPFPGKIDEEEIADEVGRRFIAAVEARSQPGERVGLMLSGGLDSRSILAAMPTREGPINVVTFGREGCLDAQIARKAATVKNAEHHFVEVGPRNFLRGRLAGVWWNDGQPSLQDMHVSALLPMGRELFDITLDGFFGDALVGALHMRPWASRELWKINNRGRRFIINGPRFCGTWLECRLPFVDYDLTNFVMSLPKGVRGAYHIYRMMLLRTFPEYFVDIPWQATGRPIRHPRLGGQLPVLKHRWMWKWFVAAVKRRMSQAAYKRASFVDYAAWIRVDPARSFVQSILENPKALYPEYLPRESALKDWRRHLDGADQTRRLFLAVTLEIWLQQVFQGRYRPGMDGRERWDAQ